MKKFLICFAIFCVTFCCSLFFYACGKRLRPTGVKTVRSDLIPKTAGRTVPIPIKTVPTLTIMKISYIVILSASGKLLSRPIARRTASVQEFAVAVKSKPKQSTLWGTF